MNASTSPRNRGGWRRSIDPLIFVGLFVAYLAWLLSTAKDLGYARDEGFYFHAARTYGRWFELLFTNPGQALQPAIVDQHWQENHEHPALMKSLFWASQRWLYGSVFEERGTAYRFPAMLLSALAVATTFAWGRRTIGRAGGVVAALFLAFIPSIFYHSHLSCFDMPIAALWLFTAYAYFRSLESPRLGWAIGCAVLYGLALNTKHNSWFLPSALVAHAFVRHGFTLPRTFRGALRRVPLALVLMAVLGPAILYATWPWIWHDTLDRFTAYVKFHTQHVYYNMEFLGETYFEPPFPRAYAWLMTLATVPASLLLSCSVGVCVVCCRRWKQARVWAGFKAVAEPRPTAAVMVPRPGAWASLWLLCIVVSYGPWLSTSTPIFGGTKHWLSAYPFLALFAGQGFVWLAAVLSTRSAGAWPPMGAAGASPRRRRVVQWGLGACLLLGPFTMAWQAHPWGLAAYTPLVGGAPGAASLGLNRSFWGYTTGSVVDYLNAATGESDRVFVHDTAVDSFRMLQTDGRLRKDIKPWWTVAGSKFAIYHHEQHMSRVEHMIWVDYGTIAPAHMATYDGVPIVWVYERAR